MSTSQAPWDCETLLQRGLKFSTKTAFEIRHDQTLDARVFSLNIQLTTTKRFSRSTLGFGDEKYLDLTEDERKAIAGWTYLRLRKARLVHWKKWEELRPEEILSPDSSYTEVQMSEMGELIQRVVEKASQDVGEDLRKDSSENRQHTIQYVRGFLAMGWVSKVGTARYRVWKGLESPPEDWATLKSAARGRSLAKEVTLTFVGPEGTIQDSAGSASTILESTNPVDQEGDSEAAGLRDSSDDDADTAPLIDENSSQ